MTASELSHSIFAGGGRAIALRRGVALLRLWSERRRRRRCLAALDDRLLADVGLSRADAARECGKPFFWHK